MRDAAVREVKEETGVEAEFRAIVSLRETHDVHFGKSDVFALCVLKPLSSRIVKQDSEIEAAMWMRYEDLRRQPPFKNQEIFNHTMDLCFEYVKGKQAGFEPVRLEGMTDKKRAIYAAPQSPPA